MFFVLFLGLVFFRLRNFFRGLIFRNRQHVVLDRVEQFVTGLLFLSFPGVVFAQIALQDVRHVLELLRQALGYSA